LFVYSLVARHFTRRWSRAVARGGPGEPMPPSFFCPKSKTRHVLKVEDHNEKLAKMMAVYRDTDL